MFFLFHDGLTACLGETYGPRNQGRPAGGYSEEIGDRIGRLGD
jgi:hypothetical protein